MTAYRTRQTVRRLVFAVATAVAATGCDRADPLAPQPVEFQVLTDGKPAVGAMVVLHPVGAAGTAQRPMGHVGEDGTVRISTRAQADGAPVGEYAVTVTWFDITSTPERAVVVKGGDKLKGKYDKPDAPNAPKVTVREGVNKLPAINL